MDRVQVNTRERPVSTDINDLQATELRMLSLLVQGLSARRRMVETDPTGDDNAPRAVTTGLSMRGNGTDVTVEPGMLAQHSTTHPAALGPLDVAMRLGFLRQQTVFAFPATPNSFALMEARVVDVVAATESRDVMDGTGNFIPTLVTKRVERRIEVQFTFAAGVIPPFSGGTWVPLSVFFTDGAGLFASAFGFVDLRPDMADFLQSSTDNGLASAGFAQAEVFRGELFFRGPGAINFQVAGGVSGSVRGQRYYFRGSTTPAIEAAIAAANVHHLYLIPLISNGVTAVPKFGTNATQGYQGWPLRASVIPDTLGRTNGASLTLGGILANFGPVPAGTALHAGAGWVDVGGAGWSPGIQNPSGRYVGGNANSGIGGARTRVNSSTNIALLGSIVHDILLDPVLPANAKTAILGINIELIQNAAANRGLAHLYPDGVVNPVALTALPAVGDFWYQTLVAPLLAGIGVGAAHTYEVEVPVRNHLASANTGRTWRLALLNPSAAGLLTQNTRVELLGWTI